MVSPCVNTITQRTMEYKAILIEPNTGAWDYAWQRLAQHHKTLFGTADTIARNPEYREVWQYMCTLVFPNGLVRHEFRHRMHPIANQRLVWQLNMGTLDDALIPQHLRP